MQSDVLFFFSGSASKPPGRGANEYVANPAKYAALASIPDWRKMLSNFWVAPFEMNGVRWNTVEHAFQAYKLNIANPNVAFALSLDSGTPLSREDGLAARNQRKAALLTPAQMQQWESIKDNVIYAALYAKFNQNPDLKRVLLLTQDAQLWHGAPRTPKARQYLLEKVRAQLTAQENNLNELSFEDLVSKMNKGEIVEFSVNPILAPLARPNNVIFMVRDQNGQQYRIEGQYNASTNQIFPPLA